jgi:hypothetical protein
MLCLDGQEVIERERKLISQISINMTIKSNVAKWLKSTDISKYLTVIVSTLAYSV